MTRQRGRARRRGIAVGALGVALGAVMLAPLVSAGATAQAAVVRAALAPGSINNILVIELENEDASSTFGAGSPATYLNDTLVPQGELLDRLLRHRSRQPGQLHRRGVGPGSDATNGRGLLRLVHQRLAGLNDPTLSTEPGTGRRYGVRLPDAGADDRQPARRRPTSQSDHERGVVARIRGKTWGTSRAGTAG